MIRLGNEGIPFNDFESIEKAIPENNSFYTELLDLLKRWYNTDFKQFDVMTSGSTGQPKRITLSREDMICSARRSSRFFDFLPGKRALLCLPVNYIAGKIMVVRSIISDLELDVVLPSSNPLKEIDHELDFVAMTPMQLNGVLKENPEKLKLVKTILLGGASVSSELKRIIPGLKPEVYLGYGMTETITHIALTNLSDNETSHYRALEGIRFETDDRNCLIIHDNLIGHSVQTNDVVELINPFTVKWLGRVDNVINSGGIKIHPEAIESSLEEYLETKVLVMSEQDDILGEKMVLVVENGQTEFDGDQLRVFISDRFDRYHIPRTIYSINEFPLLESGKINRRKAFQIAKEKGQLLN